MKRWCGSVLAVAAVGAPALAQDAPASGIATISLRTGDILCMVSPQGRAEDCRYERPAPDPDPELTARAIAVIEAKTWSILPDGAPRPADPDVITAGPHRFFAFPDGRISAGRMMVTTSGRRLADEAAKQDPALP